MKKILDHVREVGQFYAPCWKSGWKDIPFTHEEYRDFSNNKFHELEDDAYDVSSEKFACYMGVFEEEGTTFYLRLLIGQGSLLDLFTKDHFEKNFEDQAEQLNAVISERAENEV